MYVGRGARPKGEGRLQTWIGAPACCTVHSMMDGMGTVDVADEAPFEVCDERFRRLLREDSVLQRLWSGAEWSEGPVYLPDRDCVLWSDIPNDRVLRWSRLDGVSVEQHPAGFANGHTLDLRG